MKVLGKDGGPRFVTADRPATTAPNPDMRNPGIRQELEAITQAVIAADEAYVQEAIGRVDWERCGVLQRLTRPDRPATLPGAADEPVLEPAPAGLGLPTPN
jgi:hypothetical protein